MPNFFVPICPLLVPNYPGVHLSWHPFVRCPFVRCPFVLVPICPIAHLSGAHLSYAHLSCCSFVLVPICLVPICRGAHLSCCPFVRCPFVRCPFVLQSLFLPLEVPKCFWTLAQFTSRDNASIIYKTPLHL